jgi:uncharacterized protein (TIGR02452 family)
MFINKFQYIEIAKDSYEYLNTIDDSYKTNILYVDMPDISNCHKVENTKIIIKNIDCVDAAMNLSDVCLLNFASAYHPGGGWMTGAVAQEECIARRTSLYKSINDSKFYQLNNKEMYSDAMIYSPKVQIFKNSNYALLTNKKDISVISACAVNMNRIYKSTIKEVKTEMIHRIKKVFKIAIHNHQTNIILGAWGCGVFKQNPSDVAKYFKLAMDDEEDLKSYFYNIVFAVYNNQRNLKEFMKVVK